MKYLHTLWRLSNKSFYNELVYRFAVGASAKNYRNMSAILLIGSFSFLGLSLRGKN